MALSIGTKLGSYEIVSPLGAGGMGEVYRARDSKLARQVALKVLPDAFACDPDRMARFQREAKVLASLDHPNIASIYGLEDSSTTHALVMALVEGPTLADRIKSGPIPIDESLRVAKQVCEGLEYAHERGIVHRDLKPANVKVTADDAVKILDFGLAKAIEGDAASIDIATSPTMSRMATLAGVLLGTAAYMSPEQAKAKPVDRRADIWAFGCVLYEMLTGKMTFSGETVTDTLAAVIRADPDWSQLPPATPLRIRVLLQRCLQKDPKQRLQAIGDARIVLEEVLSGASDQSLAGAAGISAPLWRRGLPWGIAAALAIALVASTWLHQHGAGIPAPVADASRFEISPPEKTTLATNGVFSLSPDGSQLAFFAAGSDNVYRLWVRPLGSLEARPLPGSESPQFPPFFWSPDSRSIAFDAGGKLKKIDISGGSPQTICDLTTLALGGSWNNDGVIIFGSAAGGIMRVSASGGSASPLTSVDSSRNEAQHILPSFLPDGRHFVYQRTSSTPGNGGVYVGLLDAKPADQDSKRLLATDWGSVFLPYPNSDTGQLLFMRDGTLLVQSLDTRRLELVGEPVSVAEQVGFFLDFGFFSASTNGVLAYRSGSSGGTSQITWFDQQGKTLGTVGEQGYNAALSLSPDGTRAAVSRRDSPSASAAIWLVDLSRGTSIRFTFGSFYAADPLWSPDGSQIIFSSNHGGGFDLYRKPSSGVKDEELLLKSDEDKAPTSWSHDGRFLLYDLSNPKTRRTELWVLPLEGEKKPIPFVRSEFNNVDGQFSPDGRWVAYASNESGRDEIYVRTFSPGSSEAGAGAGGKWLISTNGGSQPRWRGDGKELFYLGPDDKLMAVEIATNPVFRAGVPKSFFQTLPHAEIITTYQWDVTPDGKRILYLTPTKQGTAPFTVVLNWQAGLKK
jgi:eukaryotic-like serine/threonine-protein kinase